MKRQIVLPFGPRRFSTFRTVDNDLVHVGGFCYGVGLPEWTDQCLPGPGSGAGFKASEYVVPLILMLVGGGRSLEDIRRVRDDRPLRTVLKLQRVPSADALGDWLRRTGARGGLGGLERVNRRLLRRCLAYDDTDGHTLDIFSARIAADKTSARPMPDGHRGYRPLIGFLREKRLIIGDDFREGDVAPNAGLLEFVKRCARQMPESSNIRALRATDVPWQTDLFHFCSQAEIEWVADLVADESLMKTIQAVPASQWSSHGNGQLAGLTCEQGAQRIWTQLAVWRRPYQVGLFDPADDRSRYRIIASSRETASESILKQYRDHRDCTRWSLANLETDFALDRMPCGQTEANAVFYRVGIVAWNLYQLSASRMHLAQKSS